MDAECQNGSNNDSKIVFFLVESVARVAITNCCHATPAASADLTEATLEAKGR